MKMFSSIFVRGKIKHKNKHTPFWISPFFLASPLSLSSLFLTLSLFLSPFFKPLQGFVASHSSISLSRKPISWYLNYARASALGTGTARERKKEDDEQSVGTREIGRQGGGKERTWRGWKNPPVISQVSTLGLAREPQAGTPEAEWERKNKRERRIERREEEERAGGQKR